LCFFLNEYSLLHCHKIVTSDKTLTFFVIHLIKEFYFAISKTIEQN